VSPPLCARSAHYCKRAILCLMCEIILSVGFGLAKHTCIVLLKKLLLYIDWADFLGVAPPFVLVCY